MYSSVKNVAPIPMVSFGLPVYNASKVYLTQLLDSLLAQDIQDIEVVISDNASDNDTQEVCEEYANRDPRIRYHRNSENIGQVDNFNKVLKLARGKYFRWIGSDDWLETDYARRCVEVLEAEDGKDFIGVTTHYDFLFEDGQRYYREYQGERLDLPSPHLRFRRMVWFMTADFGFIDPIYTMMRRDILLKTPLLRYIPSMDSVLAVELSLLGKFAHVPACLAHRRWKNLGKIPKDKLWKEYSPKNHQNIGKPYLYVGIAFLSAAWATPISYWEKMLCVVPVINYLRVRTLRRGIRWMRTLAHQIRRFFRISSIEEFGHNG
ncbi:MAG: glycosyltransferase family 2 protein [Calothrix sp. MO_192.B10]|nr:glycosyltransferase family 2 protein [Calothrix sp. MO_192.B10]